MPSITFNDFSGGLDHRLPINVQEASRLWVLRNAFVTNGRRIKKRPCLKVVATGLTGSSGLENVNGSLTVFAAKGAGYLPPAGVVLIELNVYNPGGVPTSFLGVRYASLFQGFPYVVGMYYTQVPDAFGIPRYRVVPRHHYVDGSVNTLITDSNCPHSLSVTKAASRIFAIGGQVVRYCAAGAARNWTTAADAGFLPTGVQQDTTQACTAVGTFENALVVFFDDGLQIWDVATDPTANAIRKVIYGVGTTLPYSLASWASDLVFLSPYGFRSMTVTQLTDRIDDTDIGVPIDTLVTPDIAASDALDPQARTDPFGLWIPQLGQYWCFFDNGTTSKVWAYSYSRTSKIACWSEYTLPVRITAAATKAGKVYLRSDSTLYEVDASTFTDDGASVPVEVQIAFQEAKTPGVEKQWTGAKYVQKGTTDVSFKYSPKDQTKETISQSITDDTREEDMVPVEVMSIALAPVFRHQANEAFELSQMTLYYQILGTVT